MKLYKVFFIGSGFTVIMATSPQQAIEFARGDFQGEMECEEMY